MSLRHIILHSLLHFIAFVIYAQESQNIILIPRNISVDKHAEGVVLSNYFSAWKIVECDPTLILDDVRKNGAFNGMITVPSLGNVPLFLEESEIYSDELKVTTSSGLQVRESGLPVALKGGIGYAFEEVRLTINGSYLSGFFSLNGEEFHIQPLRQFVKNAKPYSYVLYNSKNVLSRDEKLCGVSEETHSSNHFGPNIELESHMSGVDECILYKLAIASDSIFFQRMDENIVEALNHIVTVANNVETNYDDEFDIEMDIVISVLYIVDDKKSDPWTKSTDVHELLASFSSWVNDGGYGTDDFIHASLWSGREFDGSLIGLSNTGNTCRPSPTNVLELFSPVHTKLRFLQAHELMHNWGYGHDPKDSPHIMAPKVGNSNTWSEESMDVLDVTVELLKTPQGCLELCESGYALDIAFNSDFKKVCEGSSIQFYDQSNANVVERHWIFEGGIPRESNEINPKVRYPSPGEYAVTLMVSDGMTSSRIVESGYISVENGGKSYIEFFDFENGVNGWDFSSSSQVNWEVTNTDFGTGKKSLHLDCNAINGESVAFFITPEIDISGYSDYVINMMFAHAKDFEVRDSLVVSISENGGDFRELDKINNYSSDSINSTLSTTSDFFVDEIDDWSFRRTDYAGNLRIHFDAKDKVRLKFEFSHSKTFDFYIDHISIIGHCFGQNVPISLFHVDNETPCVGEEIQFEDASKFQPDSWFWEFPGGSPSESSEVHPRVIYQSPGKYDVTLITNNERGSDTLTKTQIIKVSENPVAKFAVNFENNVLFFENISQFANKYEWKIDQNEIQMVETPEPIEVDSEINISVVLYAYNACGVDSFPSQVYFVATPKASFYADTNEICHGDSVHYINNSKGKISELIWKFEGGNPHTSTAMHPVIAYEKPGDYQVKLVVKNSAGKDSIIESNYMYVYAEPGVFFNYMVNENEVQFIHTSVGVQSLKWDFGDGETSTEENPIHVYENINMKYDVKLIGQNVCGKDSIMKEIEIKTTAIEDWCENRMYIYPNPVNHDLTIHSEGGFPIIEARIYDVNGKEYLSSIINKQVGNKNEVSLSLGTLRSGLYILQVRTIDNIKTFKIIKYN